MTPRNWPDVAVTDGKASQDDERPQMTAVPCQKSNTIWLTAAYALARSGQGGFGGGS